MVFLRFMTHHELIQQAIDILGNQEALAREIGLTQQGVSYLRNKSSQVPGEIAVAIHRATRGRVSKRDLRPDLFGRAA